MVTPPQLTCEIAPGFPVARTYCVPERDAVSCHPEVTGGPEARVVPDLDVPPGREHRDAQDDRGHHERGGRHE